MAKLQYLQNSTVLFYQLQSQRSIEGKVLLGCLIRIFMDI